MSNEMREFKMYLPLYDGLVNIEVGIDSNSVIEKPLKNISKPIVFYGTSITQGGCASRPGMAHTNIISRKLDIDIYESSVLDEEMGENINKFNAALKTEYIKMIEGGFENIYYVETENATGDDHEGTVDGVHFTDLGFIRYADFLIDKFVQFGLITKE